MPLLDTQPKTHADCYRKRYEQFVEHAAHAPDWLAELRRAGIDLFDAVGFPGPKNEFWRHTPLKAVTEVCWKLPQPDHDPQALFEEYTLADVAAELVFVNGVFRKELSRVKNLPAGVIVTDLALAIEEHADLVEPHLAKLAKVDKNPFVALNNAFVNEGAFIHVPRGKTLEKPLHLLFIAQPDDHAAMITPRTLVTVGENAECTVVESYVGPHDGGRYFTNAVSEYEVAADARVERYKLQQESSEAIHLGTLEANVHGKARFVDQNAVIGAKLTRNDVNAHLLGEYAEAILNGLCVANGDQFFDNHTLLEHVAPNCPSYELYKHVLDGRSRGVFHGQIFVHQDAQKTDSKQSSKTLLLSDSAQINSQPALEIYADDVKCTHGSTTGPVDDEAIFYLQSRGVTRETATRLLTYAFAADLTRRIRVAPVRERLEAILAAQHGLHQDFRIQELGDATESVVY